MQSLRHIAHITVGSIHLITNDTGLENTAGNTLNAHRTDNVVRISLFKKPETDRFLLQHHLIFALQKAFLVGQGIKIFRFAAIIFFKSRAVVFVKFQRFSGKIGGKDPNVKTFGFILKIHASTPRISTWGIYFCKRDWISSSSFFV